MATRRHKQSMAINSTAQTDQMWRMGLAKLAGLTYHGRRNLSEILGYKTEINYADCMGMYELNGIAERIIDAFPSATWRTAPDVTDKDDSDGDDTPFEAAWEDLVKKFGIYHTICRADKLDGIGEYSGLLIGLDGPGNVDLQNPLAPGKMIYLQAYGEQDVMISNWCSDNTNPRFGLPEFYNVNTGVGGVAVHTVRVHWTRIVHIAEGCMRNSVYGKPRLRGVYNWLQDLQKAVGGSAEMFWRGAAPGLHLDIDPASPFSSMATSTEIDALKGQVQDYVNDLTRTIQTQGVKLNELGKHIQEPGVIYDTLMKLISGTTGIPVRVLTGSERGHLSSTQDEDSWADRISERQENHASPMILRPIIDRLIDTEALPTPQGGEYKIVWPDMQNLSKKDQADIALSIAQALNWYAQGNAEMICPAEEFREKFLNLEPEPDGGFPDDAVEEPLPEEDPNKIEPGLYPILPTLTPGNPAEKAKPGPFGKP